MSIVGGKSFIILAVIIGAVFLDTAVIPGFPSLQKIFHLPFGIRELLLFVLAAVDWKIADREAVRGNEINFSPIRGGY